MEVKPKVMIVEDDEITLNFISEILAPEYELSLTVSGEEALERIHQFKPEVVLLDLMMPGINGYEVCKQIRADQSLSSIKIILVTAKAMLGEKLKGYEAGADDYVTKPFQHEELLAKTRVFVRLVNEEKKRVKAEELLIKSNENLEQAVKERTRELEISNIHLKKEVKERKKTVERINASLKEKGVLLAEIHHRVKNNMAIIISILKLQINNSKNKQIKEALKTTQGRIYAMSAVQETIHESENLADINIKSYISKITTSLFQAYSIIPNNVKLTSDVEQIAIKIDHASPIGLIINELITNSLTHAFPDERKGEISISIKSQNSEHGLTVEDNGIGMPAEFDPKSAKTLGLNLVHTLVKTQLHGVIDMDSKNGTKFIIRFNLES